MNKERTLPAAALLSSGDAAGSEIVRTPDEQVTQYFNEYSHVVLRYLVRAYGRREEAEEAVQEAFLRLFEELEKHEVIENPRAWAFKVARNAMRNGVRKRQNEIARILKIIAASATHAPSPEELLIDQRRWAAIAEAVTFLTPLQRECVSLRHEGLKVREIGEILKMDFRRVSEVLGRAMKRMKRHVNGQK